MAERKKIIICSDDPRTPSGVGVQTSYIAKSMSKYYDVVCLGGAINHPSYEKVDFNGVTIYPVQGYGNPMILRNILTIEQPDALLLFTDPRYWEWVWKMEDEIRTICPILLYHLWDDSPAPKYNRNFYLSCDSIPYISKQTGLFLKEVVPEYFLPDIPDWKTKYIPHGHPTDIFIPVNDNNEDYKKFINDIFKNKRDDYDFVVFFNNRNIRRKMVGDIYLAFAEFVRTLPDEKKNRCVLVLHTHPVDNDGTDLYALQKDLFSDVKVIFSDKKYPPQILNYLYNTADVTINLASNEGYGIATAESLMAGTPIIINVTGGLQDQAGYKGLLNQEMKWKSDDEKESPGEWCYSCYPETRSLLGSPKTPYIFDDRCDWHSATNGLKYWYNLSREERKEKGLLGRQYLIENGHTIDQMEKSFKDLFDSLFETWSPRKRVAFELI